MLSLKVTCNGMALLPLLFQNAIANCNAMLTHSINFQCYQARGKAGSQCYLSHVINHGSNRGWFSPPSGARNKCSVLKLRLPSAQAPFTSLTTWHARHSSSMADSSTRLKVRPSALPQLLHSVPLCMAECVSPSLSFVSSCTKWSPLSGSERARGRGFPCSRPSTQFVLF